MPQSISQSAVSSPDFKRNIALTTSEGEWPFRYSLGISFGMHLLAPVAWLALLTLVLWLLNFLFHLNLQLFDWFMKPSIHQPKDIEFIIVPKTQVKPPVTAQFSAESNQEAGGKPDPTREVSPEESETQLPAQPVFQKPQQQVQQAQPKQQVSQPKPEQPPKTEQPAKPEPPKPKIMTQSPKGFYLLGFSPPKLAKQSDIKNVTSTTQQSAAQTNTSGPVVTSSSPNAAQVAQAASPLLISPEGALHIGTATGQRPLNPEAGAAKTPGVNALQNEFGPYVAELKRRLARNWHPPRGAATRQVILNFEIGRDGRLEKISVQTSSGNPEADLAAIAAVQVSAPFQPLPDTYTGQSVPIVFTFDYKVLGSGAR